MKDPSRREFLRRAAGVVGGWGAALALGAGRAHGLSDREGARRTGTAPPGGRVEPAARSIRLLILGGTRFIGPHQVKHAVDRGHRVSIFNRGRTEPPFFHEYFERVERLEGDRDDDLAALESGEWDAVIDNSASIPRWVRQSAGLLRDRAGTYLFVSSISAYRDFAQVGIEEDYPLAALDDPTVEEVTGETYGGLKALCEEEARRAFGDAAIVVRPGLIIGPGDNTDRWTYWPVRVDRGGEMIAPGTPDDPVQHIDARDLAAWMIRLVEEQGNGGTYNATGPARPRTMGGMLETVRNALGADASFTWIPADFLARHDVQPWAHMPAWIPPEGESRGILRVSVERAVSKGLVFRALADTARDTLAWWRTLPEERRAEPRAGLPPGREAEVLAAWNARDAG